MLTVLRSARASAGEMLVADEFERKVQADTAARRAAAFGAEAYLIRVVEEGRAFATINVVESSRCWAGPRHIVAFGARAAGHEYLLIISLVARAKNIQSIRCTARARLSAGIPGFGTT